MSAPGPPWEKDVRTRNHDCQSVVFRQAWDKAATVRRRTSMIVSNKVGRGLPGLDQDAVGS
jgi:hypothetical protein